ncbi:MAG TPA: nucleoside triphosphate pyrophosphohydrolase [Halanaerobiales bacterium]|nr:nucleoside triphosphate pyrophosphohydrolase [Halanaerobiales bacterium]
MKRSKEEFERLLKIMETLRGPDGCPWDKEQDYLSLQPYIIEEAYEVVEALQKRDFEHLREELGDLLLQVVFEAQIAREREDFDIADVLEGINQKLIRRHPHVFQDKSADNSTEVRQLWDKIKEEEKEEKINSLMDKLSFSQTALNQACEVQEIAAKVGFDWKKTEGVIKKVEEELTEIKMAINEENSEKIEEEIGDLLFAVVNLSRFCRTNSEIALTRSILKFRERFKYIEKRVREKGQDIKEMSLEGLDSLWEESKIK